MRNPFYKQYFLKDPKLSDVAKREKEKIGKSERIQSYPKEKTLLDLLSSEQKKETFVKRLIDLVQ